MIDLKEYAKRRERFARSLNGAVALVFAGEHTGHGRFKSDRNFHYLTGLENEPGAVVLFDPNADNPRRRTILFLKPLDIEAQKWDGLRDAIGGELKLRSGFETIMRLPMLPMLVTQALRRSKQAACVHPYATYPAPVSSDLAVFQQVQQRIPGISTIDHTQLLVDMRAIKSPAEIQLTEKAAAITAQAYKDMLPLIRPGGSEAEVHLALDSAYTRAGGEPAYGTIVGSGLNGTVLHYIENNKPFAAGDLVVIDSAASFGGYASDITRTYPVGGKFTPEQRDLYETVLAAELAAIKAVKPGVRLHDLDAVARNVIDNAGYGDFFIHSIGHPLGLHVHDVTPDTPLQAGVILTIEPGIYLPEMKLGIRIEDDILITKSGGRNLTEMVPKTVKDIEALMSRKTS